jgi:hypothetical protein
MVALTVAIGLFAAEPMAQEIVVERGPLKRFVQLQPLFRTTRIENSRTGEVLRFAIDTPEFIIESTDGKRFTTDDFEVRSNEAGKVLLETTRGNPLRVVIEHPDSSNGTLARRLTLEGFGDVQRLAVEAMKLEVRRELGGLGQPLFLNERWFAGLEHPAGINSADAETGCILLRQHPSKNVSMKAVIGGVNAKDDRLDDAFERYIDSIRRSKPKPLLQYNTWYDLRGTELNPDNAKLAAKAIHDKLLKPFDLQLHSFVLDDGWQEPKSLWEPNGAWKKELAEYAAFLHQHRSKLGLWMPLNGTSLDVSWGESQGLDKTDFRKPCYCLASSQYRSALKARTVEHRTLPVAFYKHDFNYLTCTADGHAHLPTKEHGREANVEGQLELLDKIQTTSAVTSNAWPSPYWLMHTEYLWIGSYDYAEDWSVPCWSKRQAEMTFRDRQIHRLLRIDRTPVPMNALMTHGLIRGRHEGADADRDLNDWADYVMMFLGRGVMLQELYITPDLLGEEEWKILGAALRWADRRAETLIHTRMIGGRPDGGEPYGYIHWSADMGIVCLRNPSPRPAQVTLTTAQRPIGLPARSRWTALKIYPDRRKAPDLISNEPWTIPLNGHEVAVIEFHDDQFFSKDIRKIPVGQMKTSYGPHGVIGVDSVDVTTSSLAILENEPDRLDWKFEWQTKAGERSEVVWWLGPNDGAVASASAVNSVESPSDVSPPSWSLHRRPVDTGRIRNEFSLKLPWSPFWPQETKVSAVIRTTRDSFAGHTPPYSLPLTTDLPEIRPNLQKEIVEESLVLDGWRFHRRRSLPEKIGWVLALGLAPVSLLGGVGRKLGTKWGRPKTLGVITAATLITLYTLTPLGGALGRVLGEF